MILQASKAPILRVYCIAALLLHRRAQGQAPGGSSCAVGQWGSWGACSVTCGVGQRSRKRSVEGTGSCPLAVDRTFCTAGPCPHEELDCVVSAWSEWGHCSRSCFDGVHKGHHTRTRKIVQPQRKTGKPCPRLRRKKHCKPRAADCEVSPWGSPTACDVTCGTGTREEKRSIVAHPEAGGKACPQLLRSIYCVGIPCPIVDCQVSAWSVAHKCNKPCGKGTAVMKRKVIRKQQSTGKACPLLRKSVPCEIQSCDCLVGDWGDFKPCSKSCGLGTHSRSRRVLKQRLPGGAPCPKLTVQKYCNGKVCPVDCQVGAWSAWTPCTRSCATGHRRRHRSVVTAAKFGGRKCSALHSSSTCDTAPCPVDCHMSSWHFGACSASCDGGHKSGSRSVVAKPSLGGRVCSKTLTTSRGCNSHICPRDCVLTSWTPWSSCATSIISQRSRRPLATALGGGKPCGKLSETKSCVGNGGAAATPDADAGTTPRRSHGSRASTRSQQRASRGSASALALASASAAASAAVATNATSVGLAIRRTTPLVAQMLNPRRLFLCISAFGLLLLIVTAATSVLDMARSQSIPVAEQELRCMNNYYQQGEEDELDDL